MGPCRILTSERHSYQAGKEVKSETPCVFLSHVYHYVFLALGLIEVSQELLLGSRQWRYNTLKQRVCFWLAKGDNLRLPRAQSHCLIRSSIVVVSEVRGQRSCEIRCRSGCRSEMDITRVQSTACDCTLQVHVRSCKMTQGERAVSSIFLVFTGNTERALLPSCSRCCTNPMPVCHVSAQHLREPGTSDISRR